MEADGRWAMTDVDMERPPSPDVARERRWVQRQRAITASVDAQRLATNDEPAVAGMGGRRTRALRRTALRTVGEMRTNWEQLRQGVLRFPTLEVAEVTRPLQQRRARTLLPDAGEHDVAPRSSGVPANDVVSDGRDAAERSWEILAAFTAQRSRPSSRAPSQPRSAAAVAPPASDARDVGHLEHLAFARRWREQREQRPDAALRRQQRVPSPPRAPGDAPVQRGGFRIPKRKLDT